VYADESLSTLLRVILQVLHFPQTNSTKCYVRKNHAELQEERGKRTNMNEIVALCSVILCNSLHGLWAG